MTKNFQSDKLCSIKYKSYDEDGFYQAFSQRVGDGEIPIKTNRNLIPSELKVQKSNQVGAFRVGYVSASELLDSEGGRNFSTI